MAGGLAFLTGAVVGANEIAEDNLKQKNKLKEIQWNLSRQAAFDTIKRFQETYASEEAKARQTEQNMRALHAKGLHPVAINKAFEMGMDLSKEETVEYIRGMKISPRAVQKAQPNTPVAQANPMGMPTTNSPNMQGTPQPAMPQGTGAAGGGSGAFPAPAAQPQVASAQPGMGGQPQAQQGVQTTPAGVQITQPSPQGGIVRGGMGRPKNLPDMQPLQNAYETLGYKGADLQKQLAPFQQMQNSRVMPMDTGPEEFDITLPPPKSLQEASTKAEALVMQNLERINSAEEATQVWRSMMKSFQVSDEDIGRVQPAFAQAPASFWQNPEQKRKVQEQNEKALAVQLAQEYHRNGRADEAQKILAKYFPLSDTMTMDTGKPAEGARPVLTRRESTSKTALDPNPGYNQIRAALPTFYAGKIVFNPSTQQIEIKDPGINPGLTEEITQTLAKAEKMYQKSLREEGGKIVAMTPTETLVEAQKIVRATRSAFDKYVNELSKIKASRKGKIVTEEDDELDKDAALLKLSAKERALVIQRRVERGED
jgi:hypothetical protein